MVNSSFYAAKWRTLCGDLKVLEVSSRISIVFNALKYSVIPEEIPISYKDTVPAAAAMESQLK